MCEPCNTHNPALGDTGSCAGSAHRRCQVSSSMVSMAAGFRTSLSAVKLRTQSLANSFRNCCHLFPAAFIQTRSVLCSAANHALCIDQTSGSTEAAASTARKHLMPRVGATRHPSSLLKVFSRLKSIRKADSMEARCDCAQIYYIKLACRALQRLSRVYTWVGQPRTAK